MSSASYVHTFEFLPEKYPSKSSVFTSVRDRRANFPEPAHQNFGECGKDCELIKMRQLAKTELTGSACKQDECFIQTSGKTGFKSFTAQLSTSIEDYLLKPYIRMVVD